MNKQNEQEYLVQKIRTQYTGKKHTELDELVQLDRKVKKPAGIFAWTFGTIAALVMGAGMSLIMTDLGAQLGLGDVNVPGLALGIAGLAMAIANYPVYQKLLGRRREKYAAEIIALSDRLTMN